MSPVGRCRDRVRAREPPEPRRRSARSAHRRRPACPAPARPWAARWTTARVVLAVVEPVPVDVVDDLVWHQRAAQLASHDQSVLQLRGAAEGHEVPVSRRNGHAPVPVAQRPARAGLPDRSPGERVAVQTQSACVRPAVPGAARASLAPPTAQTSRTGRVSGASAFTSPVRDQRRWWPWHQPRVTAVRSQPSTAQGCGGRSSSSQPCRDHCL